jgi:hypothetical protein
MKDQYIFEVVENGKKREFEVYSFSHLEQLMHEWYSEDEDNELQEHVDDYGNLYGYTVYI